MTELSVIVYGAGDLFREFFNAIATAMGSSDYESVIKLTLLFSGVWCVAIQIEKHSIMVYVKWVLIYLFVMDALFLPKAQVQIIDRTNEGAAYVVDGVPLGIALIASWSSVIGDDLTQILDETFSTPDYQAYSETGMVMASRLVKAAHEFQVTDPTFNQNLQNFVQGCVFYDVMLDRYSMSDLMQSDDIWSFVSQNTSPASAFLYNNKVTTCDEGAQALTSEWTQVLPSSESGFASRLFPDESNGQAKNELLKRLPMSYGYLMGLSKSADELMQQNIMMNALQQGVVKMGASNNTPAALAAYSDARSESQTRLSFQAMGTMAVQWLPVMQNVLLVVLYGMFVFIVLLALTPMGVTYLKLYLGAIVWMQLWSPLFAIVNLVISYEASVQSKATGATLTLTNGSGLALVNSDMMAVAGYVSLLVPMLAYYLFKGLNTGLMNLTHYLGGVMQSSASSGISEAASGNISLGNTSMDTHNAFNTAMNHMDTMGRYNSGGYSQSLSDGSQLTTTANGGHVLDSTGSISRLGTNIHLANSIRSQASHSAEMAMTSSISHAHAAVSQYSEGVRSLYEVGNSFQHSVNQSDSQINTESNAFTQSASHVTDLVNSFAEQNNISNAEATKLLGSKYVEGKLSGKLDLNHSFSGKLLGAVTGIGGSGEINGGLKKEHTHSTETIHSDITERAQRFADSHHFSNAVETAARYAHESSMRTSNESTARASSSVANTFDSANTERNEAVAQYQQAESYRNIVSQSQEQSASIDRNASQEFFEWLSHQKAPNSNGAYGVSGVAAMNEEDQAHYAEQFVRERANEYIHQAEKAN